MPGEVAHTEIDATAGKISGAGENLRATGGGLTWDYVATALPFPVEPAASAALAWVPWTDELNRELLRVAGLAAGSYQLVGDGANVRLFTADELARGVNLAREENTPQMRQAREVRRLLQARATIVAVKLRGIAHVEHQTAGATHPITLEQMRPLLELRRAKLAADTSPSAPTNRANLEKYIERYAEAKPQEAELWAEVARLDVELRRAVVPRKHVFSLRPL